MNTNAVLRRHTAQRARPRSPTDAMSISDFINQLEILPGEFCCSTEYGHTVSPQNDRCIQ